MKINRARVADDALTSGQMQPLMSADEVADALGVNRKFVYAQHRSGALRGYKLGRHYRFLRADVEAFLEARLAWPDRPLDVRRRTPRIAPEGSFRALRQATGEPR